MDKMFKTIEEVQQLLNNLIPDSYMAVGGSFALYVAGLPLDHEPHDLDINWYVDIEDFGRAHRDLRGLRDMYGFAISSSRGQAVSFIINGITVDVFIYNRMAKHTLLENSGIKYLSVGDVMSYKLLYGRHKDQKCVDYIYNEWNRTLNRMCPSVYEKVTNPDPEIIKRVSCTRGTIEGITVSEETLVFLNNARDFEDFTDRVIISAGIKGLHIESIEKTYLGYSLRFFTNSDDTIIIDVLDDVLPF